VLDWEIDDDDKGFCDRQRRLLAAIMERSIDWHRRSFTTLKWFYKRDLNRCISNTWHRELGRTLTVA
jgi:hypothetical protein